MSENKKKLEKVKNFSRQMEPDSEKGEGERRRRSERKKNDHREQHRQDSFLFFFEKSIND